MKSFISSILLLITITVHSQSDYKAVILKEKTQLYLNSGTRIGGKPRLSMKIDLPPNTIKWYYTFSTTQNQKESPDLNLYGQIIDIMVQPTFQLSTLALALITPTGSNVIDVYLTDKKGESDFYKKDFGMYEYSKPGTYSEGNTENTKQATIEIDEIISGTVYLCLRNPSQLDGVNVTIEVVAIVKNEAQANGWTKDQKNNMYNAIKTEYEKSGVIQNLGKENSENLIACFLTKLTKLYTPSDIQNMATYEYNSCIKKLVIECASELELKIE